MSSSTPHVSRHCGAAPRRAVLLQQRHTAECTRADAALVLLDLGVGLEVGPQVGAVGKGPVTMRAGERPLTCVCANVSSQEPWSGEGLSTGGADTGERVGANMHFESAQTRVLLGTVFTEEGRPVCCHWGSPLLLFLRGTGVSHDTGALHPLSWGIRVHGLRAGGVR